MASLVLGAVGGYFFGPIGFMVGSAIGNMLFPEKQEGPRLSDLKLQGSSYGQMIPITYGTVRLTGQVVWQTDLVEHKHSSGGKGGPNVTTYTYTASWAVKLCKGGIAGVQRIWADGSLIYDATGTSGVDNSRVPLTVYVGEATAAADPTMQADLGVGNVPAFRDDAAVVFTDMELGDYGNRIPNLSFEIFHSEGDIPWRYSSFTPFNLTSAAGPNGTGTHSVAFENGELLIARYTGGSSCTFELNHYDLLGNLITADAPIIGPDLPSGTGFLEIAYCQNNPHIALGWVNGVDSGFYYDGAITAGGLGYLDVTGTPLTCIVYSSIADAVYGVGENGAPGILRKYQAASGRVTSSTPAASYSLLSGFGKPSGAAYQVTVDENGDVWVATGHGAGWAGSVTCWQFDQDLNLLDSWLDTEVPTNFADDHINFTVWGGYVLFNHLTLAYAYRPAHPAWTLVGTLPEAVGNVISLGNGLAVDADGIIALTPQPGSAILGDIVADVSERCGLSSSEYDTDELTEEVVGYTISNRGDGRAALLPLQTYGFFDGVESAGVATFVKRGGASIITIPDDDLAAHMDGSDAPALVQIKRMQEVDLPAQIDVTYSNIDASHQTATQRASRQVTRSQSVADVQLAIDMDDAKAKQIASVNLYAAWLEREPATIFVSKKYSYLEPTDVIGAGVYTLRIIRKTDMTGGVIQIEGVPTNQTLWIASTAAGNPTSGGTTTSPAASQATSLLLLDIPRITATDDDAGVYAAAAGAVDDTWRGYALYRSADSGANYSQVLNASTADVMGTASDALPDWQGGNVFDTLNTVTVVIGVGGGALASASTDAVLNGANEAVLGQEIIQFTTATLIAADTYTLSGLLRGRRGTEWATPSHIAGERFCMLPVANVSLPIGDLGQVRLYKPVTSRGTLAGTTAQSFTNEGQALKPYSPVQVGGAPITPFDGTVQINWTPRSRDSAEWQDFVDAPVNEAAENYVVQIWDSTFSHVARIITTTTATATYTAAQQVTDFGATQLHVYASVGQLGQYLLGTQAHAVIPGLGVSDDAVIAPIPPYNAEPPPPSGGCALPTTASTFNWATPVSLYNAGAGPSETWLVSFTTGAIVSGACHIDAAEYAGPPTQRDAVLTTSPCGVPLLPAVHVIGNTVSVIFYLDAASNPYPTVYPTLRPFTTYYFCINSIAASGMICNLYHP